MIRSIATAIAFLAILLSASSTFGATRVKGNSYSGGWAFVICNAEDTTGACNDGAGDLYISVSQFRDFTVTFSTTDASNTCDIYAGDYELARAIPTELDAVGNKITTISLSSTVKSWSFSRPTNLLWASCIISSGTVTVSVEAQR